MFTTIINIEQAQSLIIQPNHLFIDCRSSAPGTDTAYQTYLTDHIPGAIHAHLENDLSSEIIPNKTSRHPLPSLSQFEATIQRWGITSETQVIAYDDKGGAMAARLWWMLRWAGHQKVAVLNGGWQVWQQAQLPTESGQVSRQTSTYTFSDFHKSSVTIERIKKLPQEGFLLIDSRADFRYRGEKEPLDPIAGHIPGAINLPFMENLNEDKTLKSKDELQERFKLLTNVAAENVIFYCGSGVTACHNLLAFEYAGLGEATLYPGSWSEWITQDDADISFNTILS